MHILCLDILLIIIMLINYDICYFILKKSPTFLFIIQIRRINNLQI